MPTCMPSMQAQPVSTRQRHRAAASIVKKQAAAHDAAPDDASLHTIGTMNSNRLWVSLHRANISHAVLRDRMTPTVQRETSPLPPPPRREEEVFSQKENCFSIIRCFWQTKTTSFQSLNSIRSGCFKSTYNYWILLICYYMLLFYLTINITVLPKR